MQLPCLYESEFVSVLLAPRDPKASSEGVLVSEWGFMEVSVRWDCPQQTLNKISVLVVWASLRPGHAVKSPALSTGQPVYAPVGARV